MIRYSRLTESDYNRILKKLLAPHEPVMVDEDSIYLEYMHKQFVKKVLSDIPSGIRTITIRYCEFADFSDFYVFEYPELKFINLEGTPNNFEEFVDSDLYENIRDSFYIMKLNEQSDEIYNI